MNDESTHARGWFRKADGDLAVARRVLETGGPYDAVCFHAQQAVEKLLKGLLAYKGLTIPRTHNLEELQRLYVLEWSSVELSELDLTELTPYAVHLRYDLDFWPDRATGRAAVALAERLRTIVLALVPLSAGP